MSNDLNSRPVNKIEPHTLISPKSFIEVLAKLTNVKKSGNDYIGDCPCAGHQTPSGHLSLTDAGDKALVKCFPDGKHTYDQICQAWGFHSLTYNKKTFNSKWRVTASFVYELEAGKEYYVIDRKESGSEKKFTARRKDNKGNVFNIDGLHPILYKLPELRAAVQAGKIVFIPEGEGKVNKLRELGLEATTNPFGAGNGKWNEDYAKELTGAEVVILPDYDETGLDFAEQKAKAMHEVAKRVRVVQLTDKEALKKSRGKDGVDIIDWLNAGHTKEELLAITESTPVWQPPTASSQAKVKKKVKSGNTTEYQYEDNAGKVLFKAVYGSGYRGLMRLNIDGSEWVPASKNIHRVPYRLPELLATPKDQLIFVVPNEKIAEALAQYNIIATCSPLGEKWREEYSKYFIGRKIAILPNYSDEGYMYACWVAVYLSSVTQTLKVILLPGLEPGQSVYDWLDQENVNTNDLLQLTEAASIWTQETGPELLNDIISFTRKYVVISEKQAFAIALWVIHTHSFEAAETTPYLNIKSAEKRSGKTRLLEVLELLVAKPWFTGKVTAAVLPRKIDAECPTLLLDESDAAFKGDPQYAEALRGVLNTGYRRGGKTSLCVGTDNTLMDFSTFGPKAIAGIGKPPDTVADRSIPIELKRRAPTETCTKFRRRKVEKEVLPLRRRSIQWATQLLINKLSDAEPDIPEELDDRAAECWEPLIAIANAAGGDWPKRALDAAITLMTGENREDNSLRIRLLADIRTIIGEAEGIFTRDLVPLLLNMDDGPWEDLKGKPIDDRKLASLLRPVYIRPSSIRLGDEDKKGYKKEWFADAWSRYLPSSETNKVVSDGILSVTSVTQSHLSLEELSVTNGKKDADVTYKAQSQPEANVTDVTDKEWGNGLKPITAGDDNISNDEEWGRF